MSKIICDLCGTSYAETEAQCPICGTAKTDVSKTRSGDTADSYAYVKGGKFAASNVQRRNAAQTQAQAPAARSHTPQRKAPAREPQEEGSNKVLIIVVVILLLAIICVCAFIAIKFISASSDRGSQASSQTTAGVNSQVPCTGISLSQKQWEFTGLNQTLLLQAVLEPNDTTEQVYYSSSNENVVLVDEGGLITPVANGEAYIYVSCGGLQEACLITCNVGVDPEKPADPGTEPEPSVPDVTDVELVLNRSDITLSGYGASWNLSSAGYTGPDAASVTWVSEDPTVATVENGKVVAVGNGMTTVRAEYDGKVATCIIRCNSVTVPANPGYTLSITDFTLKVGESWNISLRNAEGVKVTGVTFRVADGSVCSVNENGLVTGLAVGTTVVYVDYEGESYECIVRIKAA